jgi:indole-3-glycerol phosphate synthase
MGFLTEIVAEVHAGLRAAPLDAAALRRRAVSQEPPLDLAGALEGDGIAVIAEVKRASPSAGPIVADADPVAKARAYAAAGAAAVSVLTEARHFAGSLHDLQAVREVVGLPLLRKDFLVDPGQIVEARAHGADAVLLIAAALADDVLVAMLAEAAALGMGVLLEAHGDADLDRALATDARVIGVNARDLETLEVDPERARRQLTRVPGDRIAVLESGITSRADVLAAAEAGASAILVGETLMRAGDPGRAIRRLIGEEPES